MIKDNVQRLFPQKGVTLIELMVTVIVISILAALAIPAYQTMVEKRHLRGAAETLFGELQFAKMESIKTSTSIRIDFTVTDAANWCYGVSTGDCDCTTANSCVINGVEKVIRSSDYSNISVDATAASPPWGAGGAAFNPLRSTVTAGGTTFYSDHFAVRVTTSGIGRIKICNDAGMPKADFGGYPSC